MATKNPQMQSIKIINPIHCSRENIELVLQETCVEYQSPVSSNTVSPFELPNAGSGSLYGSGPDRTPTVSVTNGSVPLRTQF